MSTRSPIIIIGMHRSGTSMISRILEELGLFMGKKKDKNHEAWFFKKLNDWLLTQSGGAWDHPEPIQRLLSNTEVRELVVDYIDYIMRTPHIVSYLGWANYLRYRDLAKLDIPWGWKDPRNTFTLPIWLDLFPDAKVIHIYRHGVDVANSLRVRQPSQLQQFLPRAKSLHKRRKRLHLYLLHPKHGGFVGDFHLRHAFPLEEGFALWETYCKQARTYVRQLGNRAMEIKYEEFLVEPSRILESLIDFCGLATTDAVITGVTRKVEKDRAYAYRNEPELQLFANQVSDQLKMWGY